MQKSILIILITLFSCCQKELIYQVPGFAEERIIEDTDLEKIINVIKSEEFEVYNKKREIPKSILKTLTKWQNKKVRFADKGEKYRKNDVIINPRIPNREIITILKSNKYFVMTYNHGGRGFHRHILFCDLENGEVANNIWIGNSSKELTSKEEIIEELMRESKWLYTNFVCY